VKPFRWNLKKREQLGSLVSGKFACGLGGYEDDLAGCAAKLLARSASRKLIFVGRSPENIYDYLAGVLHNTSYENKVDLLNISNRFRHPVKIRNELPEAYNALKKHFTELEISPEDLIRSCAVQDKLGFVGITRRMKNSPNTWRWQQNADWVDDHKTLYIKNLSIPEELWDYLGNRQVKVANTNPPASWASSRILLPPREERNIEALKQAYHIYQTGIRSKKEFARILSGTWEIKESWLRDLVVELKRV